MNTIIYNCRIIWISFILFLMACPVIGQVKKTKQLTPEDYHLWSTLKSESISDHGNWASYSLYYESGLDTLFVKNTTASTIAKTFAIAKGSDGKFLGDSWFGCMVSDNRFQLLDLQTRKIQSYENIKEFSFSHNGKYIILHCNSNDGKSKIVILNLKAEVLESIENVTSYSISPKENTLGYCSSESDKNTVGLLQFGKIITKTMVVQSPEKQFENIIWQNQGKSIAFVGRLTSAKSFTADTVLFYSIDDNRLFQYDTTTQKNWPEDKILDANYTSSLEIADDGKRVFFMVRKKPDENGLRNDSEVQVWNASDKELFPLRSQYGSVRDNPKPACWEPESNRFFEIGDDKHPAALLGENAQFALVFHPDIHKPSFKQEADRDYYILDLKTSQKTLFLKEQPGTLGNLWLSPSGKYVVYFREHHWWVYCFATKIHTNITAKTGVCFYDDSGDQPEEPNPYGFAGFTQNDDSLLLYDQFDIWQFNLGSNTSKKLTVGRDNQQIFRLDDMSHGSFDNIVSKANVISFHHNLILKVQAIDNSKSGYFTLNENGQLEPIVYEPKLINSLCRAKIGNFFSYVQQDFNEPPALLVKKDNTHPKIIYKSNPQQDHYNWGDSQLIAYKNPKGAVLSGVLFYPFDYDPKRQYPMIVNIYQKQTKALHNYINPSLLNGSAFNVTYYTSLGYFVLLPDIMYEIGNPGFSALDCVVAATNTVLETGLVDKAKIGIIAHSFGAYEVDFIITQTDLFAAAVAGSGVSDLTSGYLSMNWEGKNANSWRYEYQQLRMGNTLFDNYKGYQNNSPVQWASHVKTPLLSYSGAEDKNVNPDQTIGFYLALRRLEKEHVMVLYPKEGHIIQRHENQIDLTRKISEWFGYYLKGEKKPDWSVPN